MSSFLNRVQKYKSQTHSYATSSAGGSSVSSYSQSSDRRTRVYDGKDNRSVASSAHSDTSRRTEGGRKKKDEGGESRRRRKNTSKYTKQRREEGAGKKKTGASHPPVQKTRHASRSVHGKGIVADVQRFVLKSTNDFTGDYKLPSPYSIVRTVKKYHKGLYDESVARGKPNKSCPLTTASASLTRVKAGIRKVWESSGGMERASDEQVQVFARFLGNIKLDRDEYKIIRKKINKQVDSASDGMEVVDADSVIKTCREWLMSNESPVHLVVVALACLTGRRTAEIICDRTTFGEPKEKHENQLYWIHVDGIAKRCKKEPSTDLEKRHNRLLNDMYSKKREERKEKRRLAREKWKAAMAEKKKAETQKRRAQGITAADEDAMKRTQMQLDDLAIADTSLSQTLHRREEDAKTATNKGEGTPVKDEQWREDALPTAFDAPVLAPREYILEAIHFVRETLNPGSEKCTDYKSVNNYYGSSIRNAMNRYAKPFKNVHKFRRFYVQAVNVYLNERGSSLQRLTSIYLGHARMSRVQKTYMNFVIDLKKAGGADFAPANEIQMEKYERMRDRPVQPMSTSVIVRSAGTGDVTF